MNNILIIEDEAKVSEVIKAYLEREGYKVYCAIKGYDGLNLFNKMDFQLIILDLMLPDIDGEEVCKFIRKTSDVHIFMLTAKVELSDKIQGLNIGADEYLTKPLSPRELTARVNALFRRVDSNKTTMLSYDNGKLKIDKEKRSVLLKGEDIILTPNEFDILYTLALNEGKVLSREQLIQNVYGIDFEGYDRTVDVHIKNLRKKIEDNSKTPQYIITVVKVGYKFGGKRDI
ncbi:transcriptional regulatory protein WalR [Clostridium pasteurianum DSM 525 = ATCC 6013]|uniref:Stage 0 sporulation protein A homolog n=1 Tax=Clostridium pasteurianum DSM 525 = ATCC 6013 TaxID=1262449 RepID=A0A0H3J3Y2_CLOPA|nr:response regulator transcription factor [Clostridium pasteurianum]AJA48621.1 transcriptional regulatory protein WalR [Clostridium pasteurianum DSM 525 = ATCC 6013]AJA52609.1 transcriptional regulatory protein WalR [Clostridium pasteurianum DSM 525 = ATCC 6013]AOZ75851.1 two-component system response regulator [Clostridium pasteurianum DSM 525 = ATCC 6013]AOZ79647.1 two-component system response regulator [Clostridium pasteurianum]ELP57901.1 DNA-binding response regulator [Clostridium pasteu